MYTHTLASFSSHRRSQSDHTEVISLEGTHWVLTPGYGRRAAGAFVGRGWGWPAPDTAHHSDEKAEARKLLTSDHQDFR